MSDGPDRRRSGRERVATDRIDLFRIGVWAGAGGILGWAGGYYVRTQSDSGISVLFPWIGAVLGWLFVFAVVFVFARGVDRWARSLLMPAGDLGVRRPEYSLAESLVARGRYLDAVATFEAEALDNPGDPTPFVLAARVYRDHLDDVDQGVRAFTRALNVCRESNRPQSPVLRELVELCRRSGQFARVAPALARFHDEATAARDVEWAATELAAIKESMRGDDS